MSVGRLVLLGAGHAHLSVLRRLAQRPVPGWAVVLVSPHARLVYSGMVPGWIAGHYALEECTIPVAPLARAAGAEWLQLSASALDPVRRTVRLADARSLPYDLLSIDIGSAGPGDALPGAVEHALPIRPMERFVQAWPGVTERMAFRCAPFRVLVAGGGAGAFELALAIRHRAMVEGWSHVHVAMAGSDDEPLASGTPGLRRRAAALMRQRCIGWHGGSPIVRIEAGVAHRDAAPALPFDACIVATGAMATPWIRASGVGVDERGFVQVDACLRSASHPEVHAAGDVAALRPQRPRSGVYAVRAGPVLARNLAAAMEGRAPQPWRPQERALYLLSTADRRAIAVWGGWSASGRAAWAWKDRIDRRFVQRWHAPSG